MSLSIRGECSLPVLGKGQKGLALYPTCSLAKDYVVPFPMMDAALYAFWSDHDEFMIWKRFLHYWPFVGGIHHDGIPSKTDSGS